MRFLVRANLKAHGRQYVASSIAIIVCCIFITACSSLASVLNWVSGVGATGGYQNTQAVITTLKPDAKHKVGVLGKKKLPDRGEHPDGVKEAYKLIPEMEKELPGKLKFQPVFQGHVKLKHGDRTLPGMAQQTLDEPFYRQALASGTYPKDGFGIIVSGEYLEFLKAKVGDEVKLLVSVPPTEEEMKAYGKAVAEAQAKGQTPPALPQVKDREISAKITGKLVDDVLVKTGEIPSLQLSAALFKEVNPEASPSEILVHSELDPQKTTKEIGDFLNEKGIFYDNNTVATVDDIKTAGSESNSAKALTSQGIALIFPMLAVLVCIMIVSTTFTVVMARRKREMALLRCIGATATQVRRASFQECMVMGLIAAAVGASLGWTLCAITAIGLGWIGSIGTYIEAVGYVPLLISFISGWLVAIFAGIKPSIGISKIRPIAALNAQALEEKGKRKRHIVRFIFVTIFLIIGALFWWQAYEMTRIEDYKAYAPVLCFFGCIFFFWAALLLSRVLLPAFCTLLTKPFAGRSATAHIAGINVSRDPARTGATATALVLGLTLIGSILIGTSSLETTIIEAVNRKIPIDLAIYSNNLEKQFTDRDIAKIQKNELIKELVKVPSTKITAVKNGDGKPVQLHSWQMEMNSDQSTPDAGKDFTLATTTPNDVGTVARGKIAQPEPGTAYIGMQGFSKAESKKYLNKEWTFTFSNGKTLQLKLLPQPKIPPMALGAEMSLLMNRSDFNKLLGSEKPLYYGILAKTDDSLSAFKVFEHFQELAVSFDDIPRIDGAAVIRAVITVVLNVLMAILLALLGVSAMVALIGVANTLSLSVADRARETALLRAIGFTRGQIKRMLTIEGVLMGLGALLVSLGISLVFVWFMLRCIPFEGLIEENELVLQIPWLYGGLVVLVTLACCFFASILPGRRASKASPVEALAAADQ